LRAPQRSDARYTACVRWLVVVALTGCGRIGFDPGSGPSGPIGDANGIGGDGGNGPTDGAGGSVTGSGTIMGQTPTGSPFGSITAAYVIGHPAVSGQTWIYLFSAPIACNELAPAGWAIRVTPTNVLALELGGATTGTYPLGTAMPPPSQQANALCYQIAFTGAPSSYGEAIGQVALTAVASDGTVTGNFSANDSFADTLTGTFVAPVCGVGSTP
jgi:hypothetical protein